MRVASGVHVGWGACGMGCMWDGVHVGLDACGMHEECMRDTCGVNVGVACMRDACGIHVGCMWGE